MVDIAGHRETKLTAISCYRSQFPPEKAHGYPRVRALGETVGLMAGCDADELLAGPRIPVTTEPLRMLFLSHSGWAAGCPSAAAFGRSRRPGLGLEGLRPGHDAMAGCSALEPTAIPGRRCSSISHPAAA